MARHFPRPLGPINSGVDSITLIYIYIYIERERDREREREGVCLGYQCIYIYTHTYILYIYIYMYVCVWGFTRAGGDVGVALQSPCRHIHYTITSICWSTIGSGA